MLARADSGSCGPSPGRMLMRPGCTSRRQSVPLQSAFCSRCMAHSSVGLSVLDETSGLKAGVRGLLEGLLMVDMSCLCRRQRSSRPSEDCTARNLPESVRLRRILCSAARRTARQEHLTLIAPLAGFEKYYPKNQKGDKAKNGSHHSKHLVEPVYRLHQWQYVVAM